MNQYTFADIITKNQFCFVCQNSKINYYFISPSKTISVNFDRDNLIINPRLYYNGNSFLKINVKTHQCITNISPEILEAAQYCFAIECSNCDSTFNFSKLNVISNLIQPISYSNEILCLSNSILKTNYSSQKTFYHDSNLNLEISFLPSSNNSLNQILNKINLIKTFQ